MCLSSMRMLRCRIGLGHLRRMARGKSIGYRGFLQGARTFRTSHSMVSTFDLGRELAILRIVDQHLCDEASYIMCLLAGSKALGSLQGQKIGNMSNIQEELATYKIGSNAE